MHINWPLPLIDGHREARKPLGYSLQPAKDVIGG
jgi:hypothetical protein